MTLTADGIPVFHVDDALYCSGGGHTSGAHEDEEEGEIILCEVHRVLTGGLNVERGCEPSFTSLCIYAVLKVQRSHAGATAGCPRSNADGSVPSELRLQQQPVCGTRSRGMRFRPELTLSSISVDRRAGVP